MQLADCDGAAVTEMEGCSLNSDKNELDALREVYQAGVQLRNTAPVDDDFPELMHRFDSALKAASNAKQDKTTQTVTVASIANDQWRWVESVGWHNKTVLETLALIASEVGEAINECRMDSPSERFGEELADIVLRVFDLAVSYGIDIEHEMLKKQSINESLGTRGRKV